MYILDFSGQLSDHNKNRCTDTGKHYDFGISSY